MRPLLDVRELSVFAEGSCLVDQASFALAPGQVLCVLGASGSGKSLLAHAIMGSLPPGLSAVGEVLFDGHSMNESERGHLWGKRLALLPQEPWTALDPTMRSLGQVAEVHRFLHRLPAPEARARADDELRAMDFSRAATQRFPHQLSGGMAQRVALAATLASGASVLIVDEPTKGLDSDCQRQVFEKLCELQRSNTAIILITHDVALARALGGETIVMREAEVVERGETARVLETPTHAYTQALIAADTSGWPTRKIEAATEAQALLVSLDDVALSYKQHAVLCKTNLKIREGERWAIVGPSGAGKTSLCDLLLGLRAPTAGLVKRHDGLKATAFQKLYQDPIAAFAPHCSLRQALDDLLYLHAMTWERANTLRERLNLPDSLFDRRPSEVSGGELQRVALMRALLLEPRLLVADEPTSRLDPVTQKCVIELMQIELEMRETALIIVTHDPHIARHVADKTLTLSSPAKE